MNAETKKIPCVDCGCELVVERRPHGRWSKRRHCPECSIELMRLNGKAMIGSSRKHLPKGWIKVFEKAASGKNAIGEKHHRAKWFALVDPDGTLYTGENIKHFVRNNEHLFAAADVEWKPNKRRSMVKDVGFRPSTGVGCVWCRASSGLALVSNGNLTSWKGWTKTSVENT